MAKLDNIAGITGTPGGVPGGGDGDFLTRINSSINNIKELVKMVNALKPAEANNPPGRVIDAEVKSTGKVKPSGASIGDLLDLAIKGGYGDKTLGEIITAGDKLQLKQIRGFMKNVGLE